MVYKYKKYIAGAGIAQSLHLVGYWLNYPGFESRWRQQSLHIVTFTKPVGPTHISTELTVGTFRLGANHPGREAYHSTTSISRGGAASSLALNAFMLSTLTTLPSVRMTSSLTSQKKRTCLNLHSNLCNHGQGIYQTIETEMSSY
jgi:hypothetical protein